MKIHIIGGPGAGKTTLAEKLSAELGIPHYDLDHFQWDDKAEHYGVKRDPQERDELLNKVLAQEEWITEGVYYTWCSRCFEEADIIYFLSVPRYQYRYRILRRFIRRKLGIESGKKETLKSLKDLLNWADKYQKENLAVIREILKGYTDKVIE